ncbi:MAG: molecular chaperone TorD family protein [Desulfatiglandaceae bacterium]
MSISSPKEEDRDAIVQVTAGRITVYDMLVRIFSRLPDKKLLGGLFGACFENFLNACDHFSKAKFGTGIGYINGFRAAIINNREEKILEELSVDRTRILRGTGHKDLKPPFEGLYRKGNHIGGSILEVKSFYRKTGLLPDEAIHESPDYLIIELDFMKQLCLREQEERATDADTGETLIYQETFLRQHLCSWVGDFCTQVERHALSGFYRGFSCITDAFLEMDLGYLEKKI